MVQELQVLRCFSCETFQSQIVKKVNKWECKVCGAKQSVKKVYGRGSGKDCRIHTQKLNSLRGKKEEVDSPQKDIYINDLPMPLQNTSANYCHFTSNTSTNIKTPSKWVEFMDENETGINQNDSAETEEMTLASTLVTFKSKTEKRKISYGLDSENINEHFGDNFVVDKYVCNTYLPGNPKKIKYNKNNIVEVDCHRSKNIVCDGDIQRTYRESQGSLNTKDSKYNFQSNHKPCGKWQAYLGKEDEVQILKMPSHNEPDTLQNTCKEFLTWDDYSEKDLKEDTSSINSVINHQFKECINTSKSYINCDKSLLLKMHCDDFGTIPKNNLECNRNTSLDIFELIYSTKTCDFQDKSRQKSLERSLNHLDSSQQLVKKYEQTTFSICSTSTRYNYSLNENNCSHVSQDSNIKKVNSSCSDLLKTGHKKGFNSSEVNLQDEKYMNDAALPVFEQNVELSDSDFQLDF